MRDPHGRPITYLRLSLTDRCDLRCAYCAPHTAFRLLAHEEILSYEEVDRVLDVLGSLGLRKVRVTGGEPLLRQGIEDFLRRLRARPWLSQVALTTNGTHLARWAPFLKEIGLESVNVSLDSLDPDRFREITRVGNLEDVLRGIQACLDLRFRNLKINCVLMAQSRRQDILDLARWTTEKPIHVRFIELMPLDAGGTPRGSGWIAGGTVLDLVHEIAEPEPIPSTDPLAGPAEVFRFPGAPGTIGLIRHLTAQFCDSCNRMRLTADGRLRPCLFGEVEVDLRRILRDGSSDDAALRAAILEALAAKPERSPGAAGFSMQSIGG